MATNAGATCSSQARKRGKFEMEMDRRGKKTRSVDTRTLLYLNESDKENVLRARCGGCRNVNVCVCLTNEIYIHSIQCMYVYIYIVCV